MNIHKISRGSLLAVVVAVACTTVAPSVQAQVGLGELLNKALNGAPQQQEASQPSASTQLPSGLQPGAAPTKSAEPVLWASKADFLVATRNGDLIAIDRAAYFGSKELTPIAISIASILHADYGVTLPFSLSDLRKGDLQNSGCIQGFERDIDEMLSPVTKMHAQTLSQEPPDFYKAPSNGSTHGVDTAVMFLRRGNNCDQRILGASKPHPYKAALLKLMDEYGQATKEYVEAERERRKVAYVEEQAHRADVQAKRDAEAKAARQLAQQQQAKEQKARADAQAKQAADARAAEQQRIEEERTRIQREQKKREEQEKSRIGG